MGKTRHLPVLFSCAAGLLTGLASPTAQATQLALMDTTAMSLTELMTVEIASAGKYRQPVSRAPAAVRIITRDDIRNHGWRSLNEAIASLPGFHISNDHQYDYIGTRGLGIPGDYNTRLLITLNGNRINDVVYDAALAARNFPVDLDLIERIEVVPGPGGSVYGQNAMFGVINIVTRTGREVDGLEAAASYQDYDEERRQRLTWGTTLSDDTEILVSASTLRAEGENHYFDYGESFIKGVARGMDGEESENFFLRASKGPWSLEFSHNDRVKDDPTASYGTDPLVPGQFQSDRQTLGQLGYLDSNLAGRGEFNAKLFLGQTSYLQNASYGDNYHNHGDGQWYGLEINQVLTWLDDNTLLVGGEIQHNLRQDQSYHSVAEPDYGLKLDDRSWRGGLYVQNEIPLTAQLTATLGARLDRDNFGDDHLSPRASLIWAASPVTTVKLLADSAYRAPNVFERDYADRVSQVNNPDLREEEIDTAEIVVDHYLDSSLRLSASLYRWRMTDLIVLGTTTGRLPLIQYQNSGQSIDANGLELALDKTWTNDCRFSINASLQDVGDVGGRPAVNAPDVMVKARVSTPLGDARWRLAFETHSVGERYIQRGGTLGSYWTSNLNLLARPWRQGPEFALGVYNLFDENYAQSAADSNWQDTFQQEGRAIRLKITVDL